MAYAEPSWPERIGEAIFNVIDGLVRRVKGATGNRAAITRKKYDDMVVAGEAEVVKTLTRRKGSRDRVMEAKKNAEWLKEQKRLCENMPKSEGYHFDIVGVYDRKGRPTGEATIYKVRRRRS